MLNESRYVWHPLREAISKRKGWWAQRLENSLSAGLPDVNLFIPGQADWWIELKHAEAKISKGLQTTVNLGLRREQCAWLTHAIKLHRNVALLVRIGDGWYLWQSATAFKLAMSKTKWVDLLCGSRYFRKVEDVVNFFEKGNGK